MRGLETGAAGGIVYVCIPGPAITGVVVVQGTRAAIAGSSLTSVGAGRVVAETFAPPETRMRISSAWSWSGFSRPAVRSIRMIGKSVVVRPTRRPSRMARPLTPGPASQPRVVTNGAGDGAGPGGGEAGRGGAPSNRHSVRGGGAAGLPGVPSTCFASKASTSRMAFGPSGPAEERLQVEVRAAAIEIAHHHAVLREEWIMRASLVRIGADYTGERSGAP